MRLIRHLSALSGVTAGGIVVLALAAVVAAAALGCGGHSEAASPPGDPQPEAASATASVVSVDDKMLATIAVDAVTERERSQTLDVAGKIQFDEDRLARILAPLAGQVVALGVKVGDAVRKGQSLAAISSREAAAAAGEHIESHKDLEFAEKTAAMTDDLFAHEAASKASLQQAQNELAKARSRVARSDEALRLLGLGEGDLGDFTGRVPIVAPLSGTVIERRITDGQFVQPEGTPLITIGDVSVVWALGDVFERDLRLARVGQSASVTTAAYPGEQFAGRVSYISDTIDPATRTAKVRVSVVNAANRLKPEMFASIALGVSGRGRAVMVPARALFTEDGKTFVYAEVSRGKFLKRAIEVGAEPGAERSVVSGLRAGDRVVTDGVLLLRQEEDKRAG